MSKVICETQRLIIRLAMPEDEELIYALWTDPRVMTFVGFPNGLPETRESLRANILKRGDSEFRQLLIVELKDSGCTIGQCKMDEPGADGISSTDVKLLPEFWGKRYGVEVKRALVDYLFLHTDCDVVEATPNVNNIASIKMQEAVGGVCVDQRIYTFPESMRDGTCPVHAYVYQVYRKNWMNEQNKELCNE
jgi:RimJ/RimL family protein N-acetyltransferase